jgi:CRISPR/Cas system-associated exonuclease Cas4 (RecB family)
MKGKVIEIAEKIRNLKEPGFPANFKKCESCRLKESCYEL